MSVRMLRRASYAMLGLAFVACADSSPTGPVSTEFSEISSGATVVAGRPVIVGDTLRDPRRDPRDPRIHPCRDRDPSPRCRLLNDRDPRRTRPDTNRGR